MTLAGVNNPYPEYHEQCLAGILLHEQETAGYVIVILVRMTMEYWDVLSKLFWL